MTNREEGEKLIRKARMIFERDVQGAWRDQDHNLTVRRAQETVELTLKGALRILGVDYPKIHDVGLVFLEQTREKAPHVPEKVLRRIEEISSWLGEARTPSFYLERDYGEKDASKALEDAAFVLETVEGFLNPQS